ncbi:MAG: DUF4388 domain-containing protein [Desulfuromonadales bacterium]|nr:DUF4388 domain-containing protein [Desulfuromonadales bacterium]
MILTLDSQGRLHLPQPVVRMIGNRPLELTSSSGGHLLFTAPEAGSPVVLAGIIGELGIPDLLSFFNMFRKTGVLHFELTGGCKDLYFHQGEIVNAVSTFPEEDLGEVLFHLGRISRELLQKTRPFLSSRTDLGTLVVERGMITPQDLWVAIRQQAELIVYHLFDYQQGSFSFCQRKLAPEEILRLSMGTQNLIMEGLRRVDERAVFMRRIGSLDAVPVVTGKPAEGAGGASQKILALIDGEKMTVRELVRCSGLGEFDGLRILHQLVEKGVIALEETPTVAVEGDFGEIMDIYNGLLGSLFRRIAPRHRRFRQEIQIFLRDLPAPYSYLFREVELKEDGTVNGGRILANLAGLAEEEQKKLLAEGLSELVYMECHVARQELGAAESAQLIQRVQEVSRRVKALIGRQP